MDLIPVRWIPEKAWREDWPGSHISAMAARHPCGAPVNNCFTGHAAPREGGLGEARLDAVPPDPEGAASAPLSIEGTLMTNPTPEELQQLREGAEQLASEGRDTSGIDAVIDLVTGVDGPQ